MIPKITSHELNNILINANDKLDKLVTSIQDYKVDISQKLKIMRYETSYIEEQINTIKILEPNNEDERLSMFNERLSPLLNTYGCTTTAQYKANPINVFNIKSIETNEAFYRDIATVEINGIKNDNYKDILKHDNILNKKIFFTETTESNKQITITITIDSTKTIGKSIFDTIEIDPFLNGSFNIDSIRIYNSKDNNFYDELKNFKSAGKMRISLDKEYDLNKIEFIITPQYYTNIDEKRIYPFGLKHIYFYKTQFTTNSYAIAIIERKDFIDTIDENIIIKTANSNIETTISNEKIELYLNYKINELGEVEFLNPQKASTSQSIKPISININKIYAKVPLDNKAIIGIIFKTNSKVF